MVVAAKRLQRTAAVTKTLSVLLIDDNPARAEIVQAGLAAAGYRLLARLEGTQDLIGRVRELEPDVVVVSIDSRDATRSRTCGARPISCRVRSRCSSTIPIPRPSLRQWKRAFQLMW